VGKVIVVVHRAVVAVALEQLALLQARCLKVVMGYHLVLLDQVHIMLEAEVAAT
jgi:hypothetical protein